MEFKDIRIVRPKDRTSPVLAFADVSLTNGVQLCDMRLMKNTADETKYILRMPMKASKRGHYLAVFNPIDNKVTKQLLEAVVDAYQKTVEQNKNEFTVSFETEPTEPEFSQIHVYRFARNRQLKALVSCVMDNSIQLNRMAIMLNEDTKGLQLVMPGRIVTKTGRFTSYYRMDRDHYKQLYEAVMSAYTATVPEQ